MGRQQISPRANHSLPEKKAFGIAEKELESSHVPPLFACNYAAGVWLLPSLLASIEAESTRAHRGCSAVPVVTRAKGMA